MEKRYTQPMNQVMLVAIAGGSGSGKSTVAVALCKKYPDKIAVLHIDDYFKGKEHVPMFENFTNWDHPDAVDFERIRTDLASLKSGEPVTILTKSELYNPGYSHALKNKIEHTVEPRPIVILEGYLALADQGVRNLLDHKVYLDIPIEESAKRRSSNKFALDQEYFSKVLVPMHRKHVEPTKSHADQILDVSKMDADEVLSAVEAGIMQERVA